ncbi:DNA polymerase III subunit alpha [Nonlabens spongiae]|uniref:DNA polymerase III subunit alpha n=1 Tax=Nonlabens spongiae TaxID=331648 RepID=A0A1W6MNB9_9FLAO|nr:DNA polymerase III subunit alpha [Nonlabens spongiae]ARN79104.1 DNA polymerase III subunit alpha [Nonlabens spongiae]
MYLNNHTYFSLRYGTFSEEDLIELARQHELNTIVLTDINSTSAALNFVRLLHNEREKPVIGIDFRNEHQQLYVGIARNNEGYLNLNRFLSKHLENKIDLPEHAPDLDSVYFIYPLKQVEKLKLSRFRESEYIGISHSSLRKLPFSSYHDLKDKHILLETVTFRNKRDFNKHRLLRCIDLNILLSQLPVEQQGSPEEIMRSPHHIRAIFEGYEHILTNTENLLRRCSIDFNFESKNLNANQKTYHRTEKFNYDADIHKLRELVEQGIEKRYGCENEEIRVRVEKEISTVIKKEFVGYFLINWRICQYARQQGYFYVGRGSGANSIIAYLLEITDVDPIELDLYFERFINDYRTSPPDFDIDFSWDDREDITRFIFDEFENVALLGTYNTFQFRAVVRELGKVFGLPKSDIDKLTSMPPQGKTGDEIHDLVLKYGSELHDMPNYVSIHAGGILITEKPIHYYSATTLPPKGYPTVQFDMHIAEDAGIHKFDILAQRGLGKIRDTLEIIKYNQPGAEVMDLRKDVKKIMQDPNINNMIAQAKCIGCFYIESPAMRMLLSKLATNDYLGLVAASSVIRPGVAQSGMMREFILRTRFPEKRKEAHPIMNKIMPDTYGIMVYQEDVIKVAHIYAKLSLAEADILRRGMSGKYRSRKEFKQVERNYFRNCEKHGRDPDQAKEIWNQIKSFAGYAFAKGHSASYAVESYQSLYLKCYFPLEYMTATLNNGGGFYKPELYVHEAKMCGAHIEPPCINSSDIKNIIKGKTIYLGFSYLKQLEKKTMIQIVTERERNGLFEDLDNFLNRVFVGIEQISILTRINAFRFTGLDRYELLWQAHLKLDKLMKPTLQKKLFHQTFDLNKIPSLKSSDLELAFEQFEVLGFPLSSHFNLLSEQLKNQLTREDIVTLVGKNILIYGYSVNIKTTHTKNGKRMQFGTFLDLKGEFFDTVMFPQIASKITFRGPSVYKIYGKVVEEFDFCSIEVLKMEKCHYMQDPRYAEENPQTLQRLEKQISLKEKRMGNGNGYKKITFPDNTLQTSRFYKNS